MLTLQLLRVRVRNGAIFPLFCSKDEQIDLAKKIIQEFEQAWENKENKAALADRITAIEESEVGTDYKLVRGFCALLERRCTFKSKNSINDTYDVASNTIPVIEPVLIRRAVFEESSKRGFALTELERIEIADSVASRLSLPSTDAVLKVMWNDLDDNLILDYFDTIDAKSLVGWYNLSLMQTLLFNCTKLDFYMSGGLNWKRVLRGVKRLGLMYHLQQHRQENRIICSLEGPLSLFKLTDRYGTSLAKLLPSIIFSSDRKGRGEGSSEWYLDAWIVRKTMDGRKIYEFKISKNEIPELLTDPYLFSPSISPAAEKEFPRRSTNPNDYYFDSAVEEKFANRFEQSETGWKLIREPDPMVLSNGKAFIPDFMFEKYDMKVYLEIVGFWTKEYLERKLHKLADIFISTDVKKKNNNSNYNNNAVPLFIAVNADLDCSKSSFSSIIPKEQLIFYKNDIVPVKPILDYLKSIDREMIERKVNDPNLKIQLDNSSDNIVISIKELAQQYGIPIEVARQVSLRDNKEKYLEAGMYLIPKSKAHKLESLLAGATKFIDACSVLSSEAIPESCHAELLVKLGYDVIWQSIDASTAVLVKRRRA
jgi:predicted nuclease of restriction endonuclease-like RecB superfamily